MIAIAILIGCVIGALIGMHAPVISYTYSGYLAIAIVAALDSVFGGITSVLKGNFDLKVFLSGFFGNAILSILLTWLGVKLNVDIYLAAIVVFVGRMFTNLAIIRRYYIDKWSKKIEEKEEAKMRMRRKPWVREELAEAEFLQTMQHKTWENGTKHLKEKISPCIQNFGCGKGSFIAKLAVQNPEINYLGIDIKSEVLGLAKRNIEKEYLKAQREIDNVLITAYEIEIIQNILNEKDLVDRIYINFCNPWPKPRHNKKRLTHTKQLEKYKVFLKPGGEIYFKTDDYDLYKATIKYLEETGFKIIKQTEDLHKEPIWENNIETEHEKMFEEQGITTKAVIAKII